MLACNYPRHSSDLSAVSVSKVPLPPAPSEGQLLVKVHAASINPADWKSAQGEQALLLSFEWPRVFGFDFSGVVVGVPEAVNEVKPLDFRVGDRVFGMIRGLPELNRGTLAEYVLVESSVCARVPSSSSHVAMASLPLVCCTAIRMLRACRLQEVPVEIENKTKGENKSKPSGKGPRVLITGGAGGVGSVAIQIARSLFGASFIATTASAGPKSELCSQLGADVVVDYRSSKFEEVLESKSFDAILDCTAEAFRCVDLLRAGGALVSILKNESAGMLRTWLKESKWPRSKITCGVHPFLTSRLGGSIYELATGASSMKRRCAAIGEGTTFDTVLATGSGEIMRVVARLVENGALKPVIDSEWTLEQSLDAILKQKSGRCAGKVVVRVVSG